MPDSFAHPAILLTGVVALLAAALVVGRRRHRAAVSIPSAALLAPLPRTIRERLRHLPVLMRVLALATLLLALAGPRGSVREVVETVKGLDIVLVLDVSRSMWAQDLEPDRLGAAKKVAEALVARRTADRFALVTFAGDVQTNCPLTADRAAVVRSIRAIDTHRRAEGTALGTAIAQGISRIRRTAEGSRVMVLLTDGTGNAGSMDARTASALASTYGVRIYAVGIGSSGPAPFPTEFGMFSIQQTLDEATLDGVSSATRGRYFRAIDNQSLDRLVDELDRFEPATRVVLGRIERADLSYAMALLALLWLTIEGVIASRMRVTEP